MICLVGFRMNIIKFFRAMFCRKYMEENERLINEIVKLKDGKDFAEKAADYWNSKWPKNIIRYKSQGRYYRDVRTLINYPSYLADEIVKKHKLKKNSDDLTTLAILKYVARNYTYSFDINNPNVGKFSEYWQDSDIAIQNRYRDCEDNALVIKALSLSAGVEDYKVKIVAGWVVDPKNTEKRIGHAYNLFLYKSKWYTIDATYFPDFSSFDKRVEHKNNKYYKSIWWTFSKSYCWSQKSVEI